MTINEFETRTGFRPDARLYTEIEAAYYEFDGDKDQFCKVYKDNKDGLAEKIQRAADIKHYTESAEALKKIDALNAEIEGLKAQLEREQEWHELDDKNNVQQSDYDHLKNAGSTRVMADDEAKDLLYDWFGFAREKITIHHTVDKFEVNRHRALRKIGENERLPLYNATDWNYIRFDCGCMSYELYNDNLRPFVR